MRTKKLLLKIKLWYLKRELKNICGYIYCDGWDGKMCIDYTNYINKEIQIINEKTN